MADIPRKVLEEKQNCGDRTGCPVDWLIVSSGSEALLKTLVAGAEAFQIKLARMKTATSDGGGRRVRR